MVLQCSPTLSQERLCCLSNCSTNAKIVCHVCNISMSGKLFCAPALQTLFPPLRQLANQAVGVVTKPFGIPRATLSLYVRRVTGTPFQHLNIFYLRLLFICRPNQLHSIRVLAWRFNPSFSHRILFADQLPGYHSEGVLEMVCPAALPLSN